MSAKLIVLVIVLATLLCCALAAVYLNMQESVIDEPDDE